MVTRFTLTKVYELTGWNSKLCKTTQLVHSALLGLSTSLAGTALFIGLDREHGTPVSYIGLGGSLLGGVVLGMVTGRGWFCTYRSVTKVVLKKDGKL